MQIGPISKPSPCSMESGPYSQVKGLLERHLPRQLQQPPKPAAPQPPPKPSCQLVEYTVTKTSGEFWESFQVPADLDRSERRAKLAKTDK